VPFNMQIKDLPTYTYAAGNKNWEGNRITHWPIHETPEQRFSRTHEKLTQDE